MNTNISKTELFLEIISSLDALTLEILTECAEDGGYDLRSVLLALFAYQRIGRTRLAKSSGWNRIKDHNK